jgi:hypothetical protein
MSITITVRDRMTTDYVLLDAQLPLEAARDQLRGTPEWGVAIDAAGAPFTLVTAAVLERALQHQPRGHTTMSLAAAHSLLPPLVLINVDAPLARVVEQPQMTVLKHGAVGMVVLDGQGIVGVITRQAVSGYLAREYRPTGELAGASLPGVIVTPTLKVTCAKCQFVNELDEIILDSLPQCRNTKAPSGPHILEPGWL